MINFLAQVHCTGHANFLLRSVAHSPTYWTATVPKYFFNTSRALCSQRVSGKRARGFYQLHLSGLFPCPQHIAQHKVSGNTRFYLQAK